MDVTLDKELLDARSTHDSRRLDTLLAHGRLAVSTDEVAQLLRLPPEHVRVRMQPLVRSGRVFSPARGLWVAIPPSTGRGGSSPGHSSSRR